MPENALAKKLRIKPGQRIALVNAPDGYSNELKPLPAAVELSESLRGKFDWIQLFVKNVKELERDLPKVLRAMGPDTLVWLTYPKGTSKIQTDLTRDKGWDSLGPAELKWVTLISVNVTWSAFAVRPHKPSEPRQSFR